jgi:DNA-binding GntR family transcriptional regulator
MLNKILPKPKNISTNEWVYRSLCQLILYGEFTPGVSITLRGIAESLGVSPMPVRDAVRRLISEGALEVSENRRVCVSTINQPKLDDLLYIRLQLEPRISAQAIKSIDNKKLKQLISIDEQLDFCIDTGNIKGYIKYNYLFHFGIYENANSPVILPIINSLWLQFSPFMRVVAGMVGTKTINDYHKAAILAIKEKDSEALYQAIYDDIYEGMSLLNDSIS